MQCAYSNASEMHVYLLKRSLLVANFNTWHHGFHFLIGLGMFASHHLFEQSEDMKITASKVWWIGWVCKTLKFHILDHSNSWKGSMRLGIVMKKQKGLKWEGHIIYFWLHMNYFMNRQKLIHEQISICNTSNCCSFVYVVFKNYPPFHPNGG